MYTNPLCDRRHVEYVEGIGAVCDYSLFDLQRYGDENFGSNPNRDSDATTVPASEGVSSGGVGELSPGTDANTIRETLHDGKLEKSVMSFRKDYPTWKDPRGPQIETLQHRLETFKEEK